MNFVPHRESIARRTACGATFFLFTSLVVYLSVLIAHGVILRRSVPFHHLFCHYDGGHYSSICDKGYSYSPERRSDVAFFPVYPLLARLVKSVTGLDTEWALLTVSNLCLYAAFVLVDCYGRMRCTSAGDAFPSYLLAVFGLLPTTCFFRMAYSESLFACLVLIALIGMVRQWPCFAVAAVIGLATATRPVGVALVPPFLLDLWLRSAPTPVHMARLVLCGSIACWGLLAYIGYQWWEFGQPLAFSQTQVHWQAAPPLPLGEKLIKLGRLEPIWGPYMPSNELYWAKHERAITPLFSLLAANPIFFAGTAALTVYGASRKWLDRREVLLAAGLLLIPYFTKGYDNAMYSTGRFAAVVVPGYLVLARLLCLMPAVIVSAALAVMAFYLSAYSVLFSLGYRVF